jgi:hypothetical protein
MRKRNVIIGIGVIIAIVVGLVIGLVLGPRKKNDDNAKPQAQVDTESGDTESGDTESEDETETDTDKEPVRLIKYIAPMNFEVGLMKLDKCQFANNTNPDVLYPINGLSPDYGNKMPDYCPCMEFIQSP